MSPSQVFIASAPVNANIVAALVDFLRENEPNVLSSTGHYMRWQDGRPIVLDVVLAREALARLRGGLP